MIGLSVDAGLDADIKRVMACTDVLVELALQANWLAVLEGIDSRRQLLQTTPPRASTNALCGPGAEQWAQSTKFGAQPAIESALSR